MIRRWSAWLHVLLTVCLAVLSSLPLACTAHQCGQVKVIKQGFVFGGAASKPGMWPWHVALMHRDSPFTTSYQCGGTIVNKDTVLTAYHCVVENDRRIPAMRLVARAGVFDLDVVGPTVQDNRVFEVIVPPGANVRTFSGDIAILRMQTEFVYDDYVQPVCIRSVPQDIEELVGTYGTVVGWGRTEHSSASATLRQTNIPVVSAEDCLKSDREVFHLVLTTKMYCAGSRNGTSSCNGDSGGGMFFEMSGHWFLRGLTSFAQRDANQINSCDARSYVVYTDVAKYITWLRTNEVHFDDPLLVSPRSSNTAVARDTNANTKLIRLKMSPDMKQYLQQQRGNVILAVSPTDSRIVRVVS